MRFSFLFLLTFTFIAVSCSHHSPGKYRATAKLHDKWGFIDESGEFVIDPDFDAAWSFIRGGAVVKEDGKYGIVDKSGDWILKPELDSVIPFSMNCFIYIKDSAFGFMEHGSGKIIIPAQFEQVYHYTDQLCVVQKGHALGVVTSEGILATKPQLQDLREMFGPLAIVVQSDTSNEMAMLMNIIDGGAVKVGLLNQKGEFVTPCKYDEIFDDVPNGYYYPFLRAPEYVNDSVIGDTPVMIGTYGIADTTGKILTEPLFSELPVYGDGMFRVRIGDKYGFADTSGKMTIPAQWEYAVAFSEGKAIVSDNAHSFVIDKSGKKISADLGPGAGLYRFNSNRARCRSQDGMYGYLDPSGKRVIPTIFDAADDFTDGVAIVSKNGMYGLLDTSGQFRIEPRYRFIFNLNDGFFKVVDTTGLAGVMNQQGETIIHMDYSDIFHLQKNYFMVESGSMSGCFSISGKQIYPPTSAVQLLFINGVSLVANGAKYGMIDATGKYLVQPQYDSLGYFFRGFAPASKNGVWGAVDSTGKEIIAAKYTVLQPFVNGYALFRYKGAFGYVDEKGNEVIEARFEDAGAMIDPDRTTLDVQ